MKIFQNSLLLCIAIVGLCACSQPEPTIEEKVLMSTFANFVAAQTYDGSCAAGKITKTPPSKDVNIYWYGNQQTLVAMLGATIKRRYPNKTVEEGVEHLLKVQSKIADKSKLILDGKGCSSPEAAHMGKLLQMFTKTPPFVLHGMIVKEVERQGGSMTELTGAPGVTVSP